MTDSVIKLPHAPLRGDVSLEETISRRRSVRTYRIDALDLSAISQYYGRRRGSPTDGGSGQYPIPERPILWRSFSAQASEALLPMRRRHP